MATDISSKNSRPLQCIVYFLDDSFESFDIERRDKAQVLIKKVFEHLDISQQEFFGLQFYDTMTSEENLAGCDELELIRWVDPLKSIKKQLKSLPPYYFYFRVKFYVPEPDLLDEEYTRFYYFLQCNKDIAAGKLILPEDQLLQLAAYSAQSELGDFSVTEHSKNSAYHSEYLSNKPPELVNHVRKLHKQLKGTRPVECEMRFLKLVKHADTYGVKLYKATLEQSCRQIHIGVTARGLLVFNNDVKTNTFKWADIIKLSFKRKLFFIHLHKPATSFITHGETASSENIYGFHMSCYRSCKNLWKACVEHHTFFCLHPQQNSTKPLSNNVSQPTDKHQLIDKQSSNNAKIKQSTVKSVKDDDRNASSSPPLDLNDTNTTISLNYMPLNSRTTPTPNVRNKQNIDHYIFDSPKLNRSTAFRTAQQHNKALQNDVDDEAQLSDYQNNENSLDMQIPINSDHSDTNKEKISSTRSNSLNKQLLDRKRTFGSKRLAPAADSSEDEDAKVTRDKPDAKTLTTLSPIIMVTNNSNNDGLLNNDDSHDLDNKKSSIRKNKTPASLLSSTTSSSSKDSRSDLKAGGIDGLMTVRMKPDSQGRFGFNVKGGSDLEQAIVVSRVAPNSPADLCSPNLTEGDHVLFINGRDVSQHTHAQVVQFIRASRETHSGELVLLIQRNAYLNDASPGEPDFQYIPDTHHMVAVLPPQADPLAASMFLLRESLESGSGLAQFEQLYRKKAGMSMSISQLPENLSKNRYRDISPYDATRVILKDSPSGYINASYVNMHIPQSGIVNKYIATQGPLPNTTHDFWNMVLQEGSTLVIMLTVTVERGRTKCHKYWPDLDSSLILHKNSSDADDTSDDSKGDKLVVKNVREVFPCESYVIREFVLSMIPEDGKEERESKVTQVQYTAWPDHGVPDDCTNFLNFVQLVGQLKNSSDAPSIVHCSAGIGRTGVLIAMETAASLMETHQPVHLLDIVRQMREQRAMLIQTSSQYKFVCEAVIKVYDEKLSALPNNNHKRL